MNRNYAPDFPTTGKRAKKNAAGTHRPQVFSTMEKSLYSRVESLEKLLIDEPHAAIREADSDRVRLIHV